MCSALAVCFLLLAGASLNAQSGSLAGVVIDGKTKETIIGANVLINGTELGTSTDFDGFYVIQNIPAGEYALTISYIGYDDVKMSGIKIEPGQKYTLDIVLSTNSLLLEEITVVEYRQTNSVSAVLLEVKQAKQVVSGVSSQQIAKSQDNNAAQIMQRIPGVTIVENRFVMIRGLSERYNNVMINNVVAPSTEVDKRTFSFDLISSSSLDRMLIFKSGAADMPGDFAGGVIKLYTIDDVESNYTKINLGMGYRVNTTLNPYFQSDGSPTDFLGFDSGFRALPGNFPTTDALKASFRNADLRREAAHSLPNNFVANEGTATPDYSVGLSLGRNIDLRNGGKLSIINSINYSTSYQYFNRDFFRYFSWEDQTQPITKRFQYADDTYERQNRISVLSNWKWRLSDKSRVTFKNLFNQIGENETIIRNGEDFIQRPGDKLRNYLLGYRSRSIYTGQLEGVHDMTPTSNLRWVLGGSYLRESEPDLRRFRTFQPVGQSDGPFVLQLPPSSNLFETGRYYGNMREFSINHGMDYTRVLATNAKLKKTSLKVGYYADYRNRDFRSRYVSYLYPGFFDPAIGDEIVRLPLEEAFSNESIRTENGLVLEEGTRTIDAYDASNLTTSAYASIDLPLSIVDVTAGLRGEFNVQKLNTFDDSKEVNVNNPILSIMPFLNAGLNLSENSLVRLAYSRTVNRPEFRELAPFLFYDYKLEAARVGNPDLNIAQIDNIDLRFEMYPRVGETFSIGAFYKYFNDPIENKNVITTEQPQFTYINADFATSYGVELEFRKSFRGVTASPFIDRFSVNTNVSLIRSEVDLGSSAVAQDRVRPLQGQSPYIVNFALYYDDVDSKLSVSAVYNIFGDRIFSVGDVLFPTIYELSRNSLDLTVSKQVNRITYKLGLQNILDAPFRFFEDSDLDGNITDRDSPIFTFQRGQLFSLSLSYNIGK